VIAASIAAGSAWAQNACTCTCFDGRAQASCTIPGEVAICLPDICPPKPPILAPLPERPPHVTCAMQLVWNDVSQRYDYKRVCKEPAL
jgi:hypothetical protein